MGVTNNTVRVISLLKEQFKDREKLSVQSMLEGKSKKTAAQYFFEILVLKSRDIIQVEQGEPFSEILLSKSEKFV